MLLSPMNVLKYFNQNSILLRVGIFNPSPPQPPQPPRPPPTPFLSLISSCDFNVAIIDQYFDLYLQVVMTFTTVCHAVLNSTVS